MLVVKVDGEPVEELDRWIAVGAVGVADYHSYAFLDVRLDLPKELATNPLALRRLAHMIESVAQDAERLME